MKTRRAACFLLIQSLSAPAFAQAPAPGATAVPEPVAGSPAPTPPTAQRDVHALVSRMAQKTVDDWRAVQSDIQVSDEEYAQAVRERRVRNVALRSPAIDEAGNVTAIELASAAIRTSIEGVEAGVAIAPLALLGAGDSPHQPTLALGSLEDNRTRYAFGYQYQTEWDLRQPIDTPATLGLEPCALSAERAAALRERILDLAFEYGQVCRALDEVFAASWAPNRGDGAELYVKDAVAVCPASTQEPTVEVTFDDAAERLVTFFVEEKERLSGDSAAAFALREIVAPRRAALRQIEEFSEPSHDCHEAGDIASALANRAWHDPSYRFGASLTLETFANVFGFNPNADERLPEGQPSRIEGKIEVARITGPFEAHLGAGLGRARETLSDPNELYLAPTLSLAMVLGSLSTEPLYEDGKLNDVDGHPPPRLVLGLDFSCRYGFDPPTSQKTHFDEVSVTPYLDFLFTEELGFRIGIPLKGKIVTRDADDESDPPVEEKKALQWSVPLSLTTAVKM